MLPTAIGLIGENAGDHAAAPYSILETDGRNVYDDTRRAAATGGEYAATAAPYRSLEPEGHSTYDDTRSAMHAGAGRGSSKGYDSIDLGRLMQPGGGGQRLGAATPVGIPDLVEAEGDLFI